MYNEGESRSRNEVMTTESASESVSQFVSQIREEMKTDNPEVLAEEVEEEATVENPGEKQEFLDRSARGQILNLRIVRDQRLKQVIDIIT